MHLHCLRHDAQPCNRSKWQLGLHGACCMRRRARAWIPESGVKTHETSIRSQTQQKVQKRWRCI